jgi:hypothetical protein
VTTNKVVTYNGTSLYPSSIDIDEQPIEDSERMADGSLRVWHRANKSNWSLKWSGLVETAVPAIRALYRAGGSHTYVDEWAASYTARPKSLRVALSAGFIGIADHLIRYDVILELEEL